MPLKTLALNGCKTSDLSPLRGMKLNVLGLTWCKQVKDLGPLAGMELTKLALYGNPVSDLAPLKGMPLKSLVLVRCPNLKDLSQLEGMHLESLSFTPSNFTSGMNVVRNMASIKRIGFGWGQFMNPAEFWKKYDAGEFNTEAAQPGPATQEAPPQE